MSTLESYLDERLGGHAPLSVTPMTGGGSCEVFALDRGADRWVLRRAPRHASSSTAHDVLREFRILDAIKDRSSSSTVGDGSGSCPGHGCCGSAWGTCSSPSGVNVMRSAGPRPPLSTGT